ncbi:hypothetical protein L9F63_023960, partial [Diploptera punctata]
KQVQKRISHCASVCISFPSQGTITIQLVYIIQLFVCETKIKTIRSLTSYNTIQLFVRLRELIRVNFSRLGSPQLLLRSLNTLFVCDRLVRKVKFMALKITSNLRKEASDKNLTTPLIPRNPEFTGNLTEEVQIRELMVSKPSSWNQRRVAGEDIDETSRD